MIHYQGGPKQDVLESHALMRADDHQFEAEFTRIRDALRIPRAFSDNVLAEAESVASRQPLDDPGRDSTRLQIPFITLDPPGSRDLDQAFHAERCPDGYRVEYAIADVGFFVDPRSEIEREAWRRGTTFYSPDLRTVLYPPQIGEGAASLLPGEARPAIVFSFVLDRRATPLSCSIARSVVRSRAQLSYPEVSLHLARERERANSGHLAGLDWSDSLVLLQEIGAKRQLLEIARGGVSLPIPAQHVQRWTAALTGYRLVFEESSEVEGWNAQISLMTGMAAASLMTVRRVGLLRALDPPRPDRLRALRLTALALGIAWPLEVDYDDFVRGLNTTDPKQVALLHQAAKAMGNARYIAFDGNVPEDSHHAALAADYAHVTAPLRRLADRYVLDLLVELSTESVAPSRSRELLAKLPRVMRSAEYRAAMLESAIVNFAEAYVLRRRVGEVFTGLVIDRRQDGIEVQIADPPVRAPIRFPPTTKLRPTLGEQLSLRLEAADPVMRSIRFAPVEPES